LLGITENPRVPVWKQVPEWIDVLINHTVIAKSFDNLVNTGGHVLLGERINPANRKGGLGSLAICSALRADPEYQQERYP